jgi:hypothetical protein
MRDKYVDEPDEYERRAIDRHPLTQRLNRSCWILLGAIRA